MRTHGARDGPAMLLVLASAALAIAAASTLGENSTSKGAAMYWVSRPVLPGAMRSALTCPQIMR